MRKVLFNVFLVTVLTLSLSMFYDLQVSKAQSSRDAEIQELKMEINKLLQRVETLEQQRAKEKTEEKVKKEEVNADIKSYVDRRIERFSVFPTSKLSITGFGTFDFVNSANDPSSFGVSVNPIFNYNVTDRVHFTSELEFELEDGETNAVLEIAEADVFLNDYLTLVVGKFLLPFNAFTERLHPTWINKLPSFPLVYQGEDGGPGLLTDLQDVGAQLRGGASLPFLYKGAKINYAFYVTNGPQANITEVDGKEELDVEFNNNFQDLNANKAVGGRVGILPIWNAEVGASFEYADTGHNIDFFLFGLDGEYHYRGLELRGEYIYEQHDKLTSGNVNNSGLYLQTAYRLSSIVLPDKQVQQFVNRLEPVVRYDAVYRDAQSDVHGFTVGMDYWLLPTVPIKFAYEINDNTPSSFLLQLAVGF